MTRLLAELPLFDDLLQILGHVDSLHIILYSFDPADVAIYLKIHEGLVP